MIQVWAHSLIVILLEGGLDHAAGDSRAWSGRFRWGEAVRTNGMIVILLDYDGLFFSTFTHILPAISRGLQ